MKENELIGLHVARLREQQRLTQGELARRSGISQSHVSRVESGRRGVRLSTLYAIARALGTDAAVILRQTTFESSSLPGAAGSAVMVSGSDRHVTF